MSFFTFLEALLIGPLKLVFEFIFVIANRVIHNPGLAIIALSLVMNVLVLPLYRRADAMQEETRDTEARLSHGVNHIKKTFSGDERMMILQTYYRQNHYKPTDALNGSVSLLLEVPFFMAAYQFLSSAGELTGTAFGPIQNLGLPDGLIAIGGISINFLPIAMTLINVISSAIYLKGFPLKTKVQLYGMALFFLIFLYDSPSGLVFYWTLNNLFSLVKTIFYKLKNAKKIGSILLALLGAAVMTFGIVFYHPEGFNRKVFVIAVGLLLLLPAVILFLKKRLPFPNAASPVHPNRKLFTLGCVFLTILTGILIPSSVIAASPQEFIDPGFFHTPVLYVLYSGCMAAGTFLVWLQVFYWLANPKGKALFDKAIWMLCGIMLVNYMFFGTDLGILSANLQFEQPLTFARSEQLTNLVVLILCAAALYLVVKKWSRPVMTVLLTAVIAIGGMSAVNIATIQKNTNAFTQQGGQYTQDSLHFRLSKTGKNVVVIMLDRAIGYLPEYFFNENPQLKEQFAGFTYYDNTVSFGGHTNLGGPPLFGGYEYTPVEMNKRDSELLVDKHNEALKVMPVLFSEHGYEVTVANPPCAGYQWISDLSIFADHPEIQTCSTEGIYTNARVKEAAVQTNCRNFFCYSIMKTMPLALQQTIYCMGTYNQTQVNEDYYTYQLQHNISQSEGYDPLFLNEYYVLQNLPEVTELTSEDSGTLLILTNDTAHTPMLLQEPGYTPEAHVDNTAYDAANTERFTSRFGTLQVDTPAQMNTYQVNMAALLQLGSWFDYLRENNVYDNTRIILVSDHGYPLQYLDTLVHDPSDESKDISYYFPLLLMKDFDSKEFTVSSEFMTNADVPVMAAGGLIENPVNPFTGKALTNAEKTNHAQYVFLSHEWDILINNGYTFLPGPWATVSRNTWDKENWTFYDDSTVLKDYTLE